MTAIDLVDENRSYFKSTYGLSDTTELPRSVSFGSAVVASGNTFDVLCILDLTAHSQYRNHPQVVNSPRFGCFIGAPLVVNGSIVGSLCAWDSAPRRAVSVKDRMILLDLAAAVSSLLTHRLLVRTSNCVNEAIVAKCLTDSLIIPLKEVVTSLESVSRCSTCSSYEVNDLCEEVGMAVAQIGATMGVPNLYTDSSLRNCTLRALMQYVRDVKPTVMSSNSLTWESVTWSLEGIDETLDIKVRQPEMLGNLLTDALAKLLHLSARIEVSAHVCGFDFTPADGVADSANTAAPPRTPRGAHSIRLEDALSIRSYLRQGDDSSTILREKRQLFGQVQLRMYAVGRNESSLRSLHRLGRGDAPTADISTGDAESNPPRVDWTEIHAKSVKAMGGQLICAACNEQNDFEWVVNVPCFICLRDDILKVNVSEPAVLDNDGGHTSLAEEREGNNSPSGISMSVTSTTEHDTEAKGTTRVCAPLDRALRVLVVDDTQSIQKLLGRWLEGQGCEVTSAMNGVEGLATLKKSYEKTFDVVFMDFLMPEMGGIECMARFQEWRNAAGIDNTRFEDTLIIGLSATADKNEQNRGFAAGMHHFFSKPANMVLIGGILAKKKNGRPNKEIISEL